MTKDDLSLLEYNSYYQRYIDMTAGLDFKSGLDICYGETHDFLKDLSEEQLQYRYAENKWTIKEVMQHLMDTERIFSYRALRISRNDKTPLPGFEQDDYVEFSHANKRELSDLLEEYSLIRKSTIALYKSFEADDIIKKGIASNSDISVRALAFIIMGHERHHCQIIKDLYL